MSSSPSMSILVLVSILVSFCPISRAHLLFSKNRFWPLRKRSCDSALFGCEGGRPLSGTKGSMIFKCRRKNRGINFRCRDGHSASEVKSLIIIGRESLVFLTCSPFCSLLHSLYLVFCISSHFIFKSLFWLILLCPLGAKNSLYSQRVLFIYIESPFKIPDPGKTETENTTGSRTD